MRIVLNDPIVGEYVAERAPCVFSPDAHSCIGVVDGIGLPRGGVVFDGYTGAGGSVMLHMAGQPGWISRTLCGVVFGYVFGQLDCAMAWGLVRKSNPRALSIDLRLGFETVAVLPRMFPDGPGYLLGMPRERCKWLRYAAAPRLKESADVQG